eukprot:1157610-Pelagomonas_calceolata.AAC.6
MKKSHLLRRLEKHASFVDCSRVPPPLLDLLRMSLAHLKGFWSMVTDYKMKTFPSYTVNNRERARIPLELLRKLLLQQVGLLVGWAAAGFALILHRLVPVNLRISIFWYLFLNGWDSHHGRASSAYIGRQHYQPSGKTVMPLGQEENGGARVRDLGVRERAEGSGSSSGVKVGRLARGASRGAARQGWGEKVGQKKELHRQRKINRGKGDALAQKSHEPPPPQSCKCYSGAGKALGFWGMSGGAGGRALRGLARSEGVINLRGWHGRGRPTPASSAGNTILEHFTRMWH